MAPSSDVLAVAVTVRKIYLWLAMLLLVQFLLGMATNLFVTIPNRHPGAHPSNYFAGSARSIGWAIPDGNAWLAAHVSLGVALVLSGLAAVVVAMRRGDRIARGTAVLGAAAIVGAAFNGASFLDFNQDYSSMIMAALFAVAIAAYVVGLYFGDQRKDPRSGDVTASAGPHS